MAAGICPGMVKGRRGDGEEDFLSQSIGMAVSINEPCVFENCKSVCPLSGQLPRSEQPILDIQMSYFFGIIHCLR